MFCPNCGAQLPDDSVFCEKCGCRVGGRSGASQEQTSAPESAYSENPEPEPQPETKSGGSGGIKKYVIVALAAAILAGAGIIFFGKGKPGGKDSEAPSAQDAAVSQPASADENVIQEQDSEKSAGSESEVSIQAAESSSSFVPSTESEPEETPVTENNGEETESEPEEVPVTEENEEETKNLTSAEMEAIAGKLSTTDHALAGDFEWALDYVLYGGEAAGKVVSDPSQSVRIRGDLQPLLNGGWKAFLFTEPGVYGSDAERYCNAEINTSGDSFSIRLNWKYLLDPSAGTIEEDGSADYEGNYDAGAGTAVAMAVDSRIDFDAFYTSPELDAQYAIGTFTWISGEKDRIALMRRKPGAGGGKSLSPEKNILPSSSESTGLTDGTASDVTLDDFDWYYDTGFPSGGTPLRELQELGGNWKCLLSVMTPIDGKDQYRLMLSDAEVQYMGNKVTILMHIKGRYEYFADDPDNIESLETADGVVSTYNGDWNDGPGYIDVASKNSSLALQIREFVDLSGVQYAIGSVYNGKNEIGEIAMVRSMRQ